jgi:Protein of unknown function (DUF992)
MSSVARPPRNYTGSIDKFGVDVGYTAAAVIVWGVIAPTAKFGTWLTSRELCGRLGRSGSGRRPRR